MYIGFEGGEGCGKTTQIRLLADFLSGRGLGVLTVKEPGQTRIGDLIRDILLNPDNTDIHPSTELLLYMAARAQGANQIIKPALAEGLAVLSDRTFYSSLAYQGYGRGISLDTITVLAKFSVGDAIPDLVFLLDLPAEIGLSRKSFQGEENRFEREKVDFHKRVRTGFLALAVADPAGWRVLDATLSVEQIHEEIVAKMLEEFSF